MPIRRFLAGLYSLLLAAQAAPGFADAAVVLVPAGPFTMGIDHPRATDERPSHQVFLSAFSIDRHEVSNARFAAFVAATGYRTAAENAAATEREDGINWRQPHGPGSPAAPDHPVVYVSWRDADAYCSWRGGRLPTEAEWEKSARGGDGRLWPWGADFAAGRANFWGAEDGYAGLAPVGSFPSGQSPYGALDLAGNVWEWCADWYGADYYATAPAKDPQGPAAGRFKVLRGGSWINPGPALRSINRFEVLPVERSPYIGFRCARSP
ncbi:MAG: formylglycine-generating enzyme family protein [Candidatus Latescibacterota bacterium]|nr:formylglycine-generating enzyme family protein [Candidatus Latescibacterota bacterium]